MSMKRMAVLLAVLLTLLAVWCTAAAEEETVIEIRDAEGLRDVVNHPGAKFRLANDIDLKGEDWTPLPFSGELDGNGFGIYNLTVTRVGEETRYTRDGNNKRYKTTFAGLFSVAEYATIRDLKIIGAHVTVDGDTHCFAAVLTGFADHCTFDGVTVDGYVRLNNYGVMAGVGGVAGFGSGYIDNCKARVELIFEDRNRKRKCEEFLGAMLSCGYTRIRNCTVEIDGYVSCHGYVHNGGLIGMYHTCGTKFKLGTKNRIVSDNTITGRIWFFEDNRDRRAYCKGDIGEPLTRLHERERNDVTGFTREETKNYKTVLLPENCEEPVYIENVIPPENGEWGWTEHTCTTCGYTWRDDYRAP